LPGEGSQGKKDQLADVREAPRFSAALFCWALRPRGVGLSNDPCEAMAKAKTARARFVPSEAQRAFVAAAAGVGVPRRLIRRLLPGARPDNVAEISGRALARHFGAELRRGVDLALSLAAARLFQIALAGEERQSLGALRLVLKAPEAWRALATASGNTAPGLFIDRLSRQERHALRKLIAKATARPTAPP
jgi:hypothetical protein